MVALDTTLRCANEPKHTVVVFLAKFSMREEKGILSHATFSVIS